MFFKSDNTGPAAPEIVQAMVQANEGYTSSYGEDEVMARVVERVRTLFEAPEAVVYLVSTGTAANALALGCLCPVWGSIYCHTEAHISVDECGAPEFYTGGAKLTLLDGADGKLTPHDFANALAASGKGFVHSVQPGALSLTNATEAGTLYTPSEVEALATIAHDNAMPVHMDGARFANALVAAGCSPADMTWKAGVDILCFGGTKNGCPGVEAVILFDPKRAWDFELRRKRGGHLASKHRYLSAQMEAYLTNDLWLDLARSANARAADLSRGILGIEGAELLHPTEANAVFARWNRAAHRRAIAADAHYYLWPMDQTLDGPDNGLVSARLVCNWATKPEDVDAFLATLRPCPQSILFHQAP